MKIVAVFTKQTRSRNRLYTVKNMTESAVRGGGRKKSILRA